MKDESSDPRAARPAARSWGGAEAPDSADTGWGKQRAGPPVQPLARPERPDLSDTTPAPLLSVTSRPRAASWSIAAWRGGIMLLSFSAVTLLLTRQSLSGRLVELLRERDATVEEAALQTAASRVVFVLLGAIVLVAIVVGSTTRAFSQRRVYPRLLMLPVFLLVLVVAGLAALIVPTTKWQGWMLVSSLLMSVISVLFGTVAALGPGVTNWLREPRQERLPDS